MVTTQSAVFAYPKGLIANFFAHQKLPQARPPPHIDTTPHQAHASLRAFRSLGTADGQGPTEEKQGSAQAQEGQGAEDERQSAQPEARWDQGAGEYEERLIQAR